MENIAKCRECNIKSKAVGTLNNKELELLGQNCAEVMIKKGEQILKQGRLSAHIAYIRTGLAKVHKTGPKGIDQILKLATPGSYVGIQSIITNRINQYSASALEDSNVCFIDIKSFKELISRNPDFAYELLLYICNDELHYFDRFVNRSQKQVNGRLAETLLYFSDEVYKSDDYLLDISRADLAALISTTRETATRSLKELQDHDIIKVKGKSISILNRDLLTEISIKG